QDKDFHGFTRQVDRLERIRKLVDIENFNAPQLCNLVQVEVIRYDLCPVQFLRQLYQLHVHFANLRIIVFDELNTDAGHLLDTLQDIQSPAATISLECIRRISNLLEFPKHKMRNDQTSVKKSGLTNIRDSSVNDDTRIENLVRLFGRPLAAKDPAHSRKIQHVAFIGADYQTDIRH